ncbi:MAG: peptidase U32 family protein, partial [Lentisphaeria bacterium]
MPRKPEILAPAGQPAALEAAVAAGADAVYFGLKQLNARRGAENFAPDALAPTLRFLHDHHARGYLTLNIDLAQRELGQAARTLELARRAGADAVLVRDAALLPLLPLFPELEFHFSTQAAISSSAGVRAAAALGLRRVVLARELTLAEIRAASAVPGIETEAFVQGALCFSCSGRCLLSSWVGGRGGNRGACTSPCRVPWSIGGGAPEKPLSMHDLCALGHLAELAEAGVAALKIEGRLKQPAWVAQAVSLYRQALDHGATPELRAAADRLGAYTGRRLTAGYLEGNRANLTGDAGRPAGSAEPPTPTAEADTAPNTIRVTIAPDATGSLRWNFTAGTQSCELRTPPQPVRNPQRAVELHTLRDRFAAALPQPWRLAEFTVAGDPHRTLPRNRANQVEEELLKFLRRAGKTDDGTIRHDLPP